MVYRRKGSGEPPSGGKALSIEEPSLSDEPPSTGSADREPHEAAESLRSGAKAASSGTANSRCSVCGHPAELVELPGRSEAYCLACSADVATSLLLTTEIDAATLAGQDATPLVAEFAQLSTRLLARVQLR
jgi:hypothetical protein